MNKTISLIIAALVLPPLLLFGLRGLPSTDRPPVADFNASKPQNLCSYRQCQNSAAGTFDVRVTTGTDSRLNKTIILVTVQKHRLCNDHARNATRSRWPMHGWTFVGTLVLMLVLSAFVSVGLIGVGLYLSITRSRKQMQSPAKDNRT